MTNPKSRVDDAFDEFITRVHDAVHTSDDENEITQSVAEALRTLLAAGYAPAKEKMMPHPDHYVMYPLYIAQDESFSVASAVWDVGQGTPTHGHEKWGVVGIKSGAEKETRYRKPSEPNVPLVALPEHVWNPGEVTVCCTTDDDVHRVSCGSDAACVGIHVYGANIGTLERRRYEPATGEVGWFVSTWAG
jgi:predicted metal-dependent enzyme (double-stranded beta helix superfamily)